MEKILYSKEIEIVKSSEVVVVGGGPAGIAAALAAAKLHSKVFMVEAEGCFGGAGTAGLVPAFMKITDGVNELHRGVPKLIYNHYLSKCSVINYEDGQKSIANGGGLVIECEALKLTYDELICQANIDFLLLTELIDVVVEDRKIKYIICSNKSGIFAIEGKIFIDATGDADLSALAGVNCFKGDAEENFALQPGTLCSLWSNPTSNMFPRNNSTITDHVSEAYKNGDLSSDDRHIPGFWEDAGGKYTAGGNIGHMFGIDNTNGKSRSDNMVLGRKLVHEYWNYFKKYVQDCEDINLIATANIPGIRETRRIEGEYTLTVQDFIDQATFDDEIGRYCYPIDKHSSTPSRKDFEEFEKAFRTTYHYKKGESYGIPYRSLIPKAMNNLLVAGRCISMDRMMLASLRVMPGCFITGQGAGVAAAIFIAQQLNNTREVKPQELQCAIDIIR